LAHLSCTYEEFKKIIDPKIRNDVQYVTKDVKKKRGSVCEHCEEEAELQSAHKHEFSKEKIIKSVLKDFQTENEKYVIPDLQKVLDEIKGKHKSPEIYYFLCEKCHKKYDNSHKIKKSKENLSNGVTSNSSNLKQVILTIFKENSDKLYSPRMIFDIIQQRNTKYYADTLWGLWKQGLLNHPQRGHYQWNSN
jgi:hypothetical protein